MTVPRLLLTATLLPACIDVGLVKDVGDDDTAAVIDDTDPGDTGTGDTDTDDTDDDTGWGHTDTTDDTDTDTTDDTDTGDTDTETDTDSGDPCTDTEVPYDGVDNDCDPATPDDDLDGDGALYASDCDDADAARFPGATEVCNGVDDDCDGDVDAGLCGLGYGGHRVDKGGDYYYALYNDDGFGILGSSDWFGSADASGGPEGVTWNEDQTLLYYNDLTGNVFVQAEPFDDTSTRVGTFAVGQVGGGVVYDSVYYVGDYTNGNIYAMDVTTGATSLYASLGGTACKPYFGNSAMAIDVDGRVFAPSSCGVVVYSPGTDAAMLNTYSGLISAVAMDAAQELYGIDYSGNIVHFDKTTGDELGFITIDVAPSTTWTLAVDENGDFLVNYWGEQRLFSQVDGSVLTTWDASSYYPGTSGYYWYVTW